MNTGEDPELKPWEKPTKPLMTREQKRQLVCRSDEIRRDQMRSSKPHEIDRP